jgi:hypothetical protein
MGDPVVGVAEIIDQQPSVVGMRGTGWIFTT